MLRHARLPLSVSLLLSAVAITLASAFASPAHASEFSDTVGSTAEHAVAALAEEGVFNGCRDGEFCPQEPLTRGQMATVLVAALGLPTGDDLIAAGITEGIEPTPLNLFGDVEDGVHADSIRSLAIHGIVKGCGEDIYCPQDALTRGQMASMIAEAFSIRDTGEVHFDDGGTTHGRAVNQLGGAGIAAGCGNPLTHFCTHEPVLRGQSALFLARTMGLVAPVVLTPLTERRAEQEAIDAARAQAEAEAKAQAEAEAKAAEEAAAREAQATSRGATWDALAQCESNGNWSINTGNGYYGGLQFALSSWRAVGGTGYPHQHSRAEQIHRAERLLKIQGWGAWPACSSKLGYR